MGAEIDRLEVQIETKATKMNNSLDNLVTKLEKVSGALSRLNSSGLSSLSDGATKFAQASAQLSNVKTADFTRLTKNIEKLSALNTQQIYGAASAMGTLAKSIDSIGGVSANSLQVAQVAKDISKLGGKNVQSAITNLPQLAVALKNFMSVMSSAPIVSRNIIQMTDALASLVAQGAKVGAISKNLTKSTNSVGNAMSVNAKKAFSLSSAIGKLYQSYYWVMRAGDKLWDSIESSMDYVETLNYFDAALGQVAELAVSQWEEAGADSADAYYNSFSSRAKELTSKMTGFAVNDDGTLTASGETSLGINPTKLMNYQATFAQMSSSMGVTSETSLLLSQALTEIGADLASVKNMDFDKVWTDMASGLAGMSRTLDKYGVNIRNVNLQQKLFELGIEENITNLNQNDKALLRTIILLDSTKYAWGDLADTINLPANQMRLLDSNVSNLSRTVGNLFLPALSNTLPYVNGLVIATERLVTWIGSLMGIDLSEILPSEGSSEIDMSELLGDTEDLTGNLNNAGDAAKRLKSNLQGFDELNVITTTDRSTSGNGNGMADGLLDAAFIDSFSKYQKAWDEAFAGMENKANIFADKIEGYFQPIKDIIGDFAIGDYFKAGQDASKLVSSIFDFCSDAIEKVDWDEVGNDIGEFLAGIEWMKVFNSAGNFFETAVDSAIDLWKGSYDEAPIETLVLTGWIGAKFLGLDKVLWNKIASVLSSSLLGHKINFIPTITVSAITWVIGFEVGKTLGQLLSEKGFFKVDPKYYENFSFFGEGEFSLFDTLKNTDLDTLADAAGEMSKDMGGLLGGVHALKEVISGTGLVVDDFFKGFGSSAQETGYVLGVLFSEDKWEVLGAGAFGGLESSWNKFSLWWKDTAITNWWNESVEPFFDENKWTFAGLKDGIGQSFENAVDGAKSIWNNFASWMNDKLHLEFGGLSKEFEFFGETIELGIPAFSVQLGSLPTYSTGGFPEDGLFYANHNELVGKFSNGKTAVANNEQIVSGIKQGVKEAVTEILAPYLADIAKNTRETADKDFIITNDVIGKGAKQYANDYYKRTGKGLFDN